MTEQHAATPTKIRGSNGIAKVKDASKTQARHAGVHSNNHRAPLSETEPAKGGHARTTLQPTYRNSRISVSIPP